MTSWTSYGLRPRGVLSARTRPDDFGRLADVVAHCDRLAAEPLRGITVDGTVRSGLFGGQPQLTGATAGARAITEAAESFLALLPVERRDHVVFPIDADQRRQWFNIHPNVYRHGLMLEELAIDQRAAALKVVEATLSARGYAQARDIMAINGLLVEITGQPGEFGEWPYWISFFGTPSDESPWGWQIDGHHLNVNCTVVGHYVSIAPTFMGSEPCHITEGPLAGTAVLVDEERAGLDLIRSLDESQQAKAVTHDSIMPADLPPELQHPVDGRMVAGAFHDNAVIGCEGLRADDLTDAQRRLLTALVGTYLGWAAEPAQSISTADVADHLDETYFSWMGSRSEAGPFYYRVLSPVVLIEFDHHPGIVFDNEVPSRNHIHSVLRFPNGGDYGLDVLHQHYERFDHSH